MAKTLYMVIEHFKGGDAVPGLDCAFQHEMFMPDGFALDTI